MFTFLFNSRMRRCLIGCLTLPGNSFRVNCGNLCLKMDGFFTIFKMHKLFILYHNFLTQNKFAITRCIPILFLFINHSNYDNANG